MSGAAAVRALDRLVAAGTVQPGVSLAPLTTYKVGGPAEYFVEADDEETVVATLAAVATDRASGIDVPVLVLGRGSNLAVADGGLTGLVMRLGASFAAADVAGDGVVTVGAATALPKLARETVRAGRTGLEFFVGIPGSVGGAVATNAGCHGSDTGSWLVEARVVPVAAPQDIAWRPAESFQFAYRHARLGADEVVLAARFRTEPGDPEAGERRLREITQWRRLHQPGGTLNAGSVFKNPPGDAAGRLIDAAGLKGYRRGTVAVSVKHANFFVADAGATAQDLYDLVMDVRGRVAAASGVTLQPEIRFVGEFDDRVVGVPEAM